MSFDIASNAFEVHVSRLRVSIGRSLHVTVTTVRGVGYRLDSARR